MGEDCYARQDDVIRAVQTWEGEQRKILALVRDYKEVKKEDKYNPEAHRPFLYRRIDNILKEMIGRFPRDKEP